MVILPEKRIQCPWIRVCTPTELRRSSPLHVDENQYGRKLCILPLFQFTGKSLVPGYLIKYRFVKVSIIGLYNERSSPAVAIFF